MARPFDLIVFDWDGTLMDSAGHIVAAMEYAINGLGLPAREPEKIRELIGLGLHDALGRLFPELDPASTAALLEQYRQHFVNPPVAEAILFAGVQETLHALRDGGYRLAIATGKSRRGLDRVLKQTGLVELFETTRCADESASKPDPQMLEEILWQTDVTAGRALMVGDTEYDVAMARQIGVAAVGVGWGVHSHERMRQAGAFHVLADVPALPGWLSDLQQGRITLAG
jgi:phosphoglycolate phosphatase